MIFYSFALIVLGSLFLIFFVLYFIFLFDSVIFGHDLATNEPATKIIHQIIKELKPDAKNFYDLGCARGTLSLNIKRNFPELGVYGNDKNGWRILLARIKSRLTKQIITFTKKNIFDLDLRGADIVYTYLWYSVMPPLEKKLLAELKPGAIVIANESFFPTWRPERAIDIYPGKKNSEQIFIYRKI